MPKAPDAQADTPEVQDAPAPSFVGDAIETVKNPVSGLNETVERLPDGTVITTVVEVDPSFRISNQ